MIHIMVDQQLSAREKNSELKSSRSGERKVINMARVLLGYRVRDV
jgi:hypothetical protein